MTAQNGSFEVEEKVLEPVLVAGIRYEGRYDEVGEKFAIIARVMGRYMSGKPMNLYYEEEFKENDADIETCIPVRKGEDKEGIVVHELPGGRAVSLIHKGSYETITRSYEKISTHIKEHGYKVKLPSREIYLKGPGIILKDKPENYLTEIQMLLG